MYIYTRAGRCIRIHTCMQPCRHTHVHTYMHTYMHIHTNIYRPSTGHLSIIDRMPIEQLSNVSGVYRCLGGNREVNVSTGLRYQNRSVVLWTYRTSISCIANIYRLLANTVSLSVSRWASRGGINLAPTSLAPPITYNN